MAHLPTALLEHFERSHGIASTSTLRHLGVSEHDLRDLRTAGSLERVLHGAYRLPAVPFDEHARCAAVCSAHPEAVISGPTAGRLWGFRRMPPDRRIHALFPPHSQPTKATWVVPYRTAAVHDEDVVRRSDSITLTSRARTALDMARWLAPTDLRSVMEQALHEGRHDVDVLYRVAADWISPRRPWVKTFIGLIDARLAGGGAESHPEVVLGAALLRAGLTGLVRQYVVDLPGYGRARFDLAVPVYQWAIEVDVHPTHRETAGRERDALRDRSAAAIGWSVSRVGPDEFGDALPSTVRRLLDQFRSMRAA